MKIAIASDHGGFDLKEKVKAHLEEKGFEVKDFGCYEKKSCDYPDFGKPAAEAVANGECDFGVLICTTGIGMSMVGNKVKGVRAALCADSLSASLTRLHNNANVLVLGAAIVGEMLALNIVDTFFGTDFSGEERHQRRIDKIEG
ncbi:MAG: ribose 5-phosphate isomerase B [Lachnospiraceae bacterium]|jgi:ribose 5-phosphate isomerase B|nr:ribose 5-phosphate isomerase B [Lachnospiraceae bacterium]MBQ6637981.1 ribose 5-phosphate isomerase B [Lachnospiraceae bacterium]MBR3636283.1 ribose 5-phosphate isomerase B [Lachnospiraceae bacterium]